MAANGEDAVPRVRQWPPQPGNDSDGEGIGSAHSRRTILPKKYTLLRLEPNTSLRSGLEKTYHWIYDQYLARERGESGGVREIFTASQKDCGEVRRNEPLA
jgi:hypothetical protein